MIIRYSQNRKDAIYILWDGSLDTWHAICGLKREQCTLHPDEPGIVYVRESKYVISIGDWAGLDPSHIVRGFSEKFTFGMREVHDLDAYTYFYNTYLGGSRVSANESSASDQTEVHILDGVRAHFKRNQRVYIAIGITAVVCGIVGYLAYKTKPVVVQTINGDIHAPVSAIGDAIQNVNFGLERRVHPGWITQCVETGERFASQNRAAEVFGGTASRMSEHLRGARDNFNGHHFIRVREFATP